jgi:RNA polymerase sigma-70 factor (ECF subfamily)
MTAARTHPEFEAMLDVHRRIVFKIANIYARGEEDRRDLAQEIIAQLWRAFGRYDQARGKLSTWMYRIALNVAISYARRHVPAAVEPLEDHHLGAVEPEPGADDRLRAMYAVIEQLDPLNRALIVLYLEDRTYAEIAEVLGITETNVATKINRLKHKLRGELASAAGG